MICCFPFYYYFQKTFHELYLQKSIPFDYSFSYIREKYVLASILECSSRKSFRSSMPNLLLSTPPRAALASLMNPTGKRRFVDVLNFFKSSADFAPFCSHIRKFDKGNPAPMGIKCPPGISTNHSPSWPRLRIL